MMKNKPLLEKLLACLATERHPLDEAEIDYILMSEKAKSLAKSVRVDNYTLSNTSDHVPVYIILNMKAAFKDLKLITLNMKSRWEN